MKIILGSSSRYRKKIFSKIVNDFSTISPNINEKAIRDSDPKKLTLLIANAKADALLNQIKEDALLVTADQVVVVNGEIREKPESIVECRRFLKSYTKSPVEIINGTVITNTQTGKRVQGNDVVSIVFKKIPDKVIERLIREGDVMNCAGALKAEEEGLNKYIKSFYGTMDSAQGVPVKLIKQLINNINNS